MFWGLIMEPLKRYSQVVGKSFHISQAALDVTTGDNEPCQVMVVVDGQNFLVCTLQKGGTIQTQLDLNFKKGDDIAFISNGKCHVHLTGYLDVYGELDEEEEEEDDEEEQAEDDEEVPQLVEAKSKKNKRKLETSIENNGSNKKIKKDTKKKEEESDSDDSESSFDDDDLKKLLDASESDEADESYKPDTSKDDESEDGEDDSDIDMDELGEEEGDSQESSDEKSSPKIQEVKQLSKKERKKLKKEQQKLEKNDTSYQNGTSEKKKDKGNKENDLKKSEGDKTPSSAQKEKKVLTGNVGIEDLKVGQGPVAKPGKMIQVYYEGRLKSNNKMFDNCQKGPGFKFRLGKNEVIKGWDVGVAGMKVGGKRRIVCPPGMAYGNKGSPPLIPPNSTLVFDVELRGVN